MSETFAIRIQHPGDPERELTLAAASSLSIGRDQECDVVLSSHQVSRRHLDVGGADCGLRITDQSSNGTLIGDTLLRGRSVEVPSGTRCHVGPFTLTIERLSSGSPPEPVARTGSVDIPLDLRRDIHRALLDHLDLASLDISEMEDDVLRPRVVGALQRIVATTADRVPSPAQRERLVAEMTDEVLGLGPLQDLLEDDDVSEVMVVDPSTIYVERQGSIELTRLRFTDIEACRAAIERIVTPLGRRIDESTPLVDARLADGSRVNAIIPPLAIRGPCITIRKFPQRPLRMDELVSLGALNGRMASFLRRCVTAKKNIVVSGGTGSGKTTLLNVLSTEIPRRERIVTIEDAAELRLDQPHVVSLESRPRNLEGRGAYSIRDLVRNALRMRPDRILVGECRAGEAIDMLQAMNTGHEGSMTTTHANSGEEALKRIETLCMMAGLELSPRAIREQIAASIHVVVQQTRFSDGSRRVTSISEVGDLDETGKVALREIFSFHRQGPKGSDRVVGEHRATGYVPSFLDEFITLGLVVEGDYL